MEQTINIDRKLIEELAKSIKTEKDLANLSKQLLKMTVERAMNVEMDEHLGYEKYEVDGKNSGNNRNGYTPKTLKGILAKLILSPLGIAIVHLSRN